MENTRKSGIAYLFQLAGKYKLHLALSAVFGILSALCTFIPYIMVYKNALAAVQRKHRFCKSIALWGDCSVGDCWKVWFSIISGTFSHWESFN